MTISVVDHFNTYGRSQVPGPVGCAALRCICGSGGWVRAVVGVCDQATHVCSLLSNKPNPTPAPHPQMREYFIFSDPEAEHYLPIIYFDEFWLLKDKLIAMNETVTEVPLHLVIKSASIWWMQLQQQVGALAGVLAACCVCACGWVVSGWDS